MVTPHWQHCILILLILLAWHEGSHQNITHNPHPNSHHHPQPAAPHNITFPKLSDVLESLLLSTIIYSIDSCEDDIIPPHVTCHLHEQREHGVPDRKYQRGTTAAVLSSSLKKYVAIAFSGTDGIFDVVTDLEFQMVPFGPHDNPLNPDVRIHRGFNSAVFKGGLFERLFQSVLEIIKDNPDYRIIATGHSLGGANAILTGVAMANHFKEKNSNGNDNHVRRRVDVINFGSPRTSSAEFCEWANNFDHLSIWRFVHLNDIIPRVPLPFWKHPGHTIQLNHDGALAYYFHDGDEDKGFRSAPQAWQTAPFSQKTSLHRHLLSTYSSYLVERSLKDPNTYYVNHFETVKETNHDKDVMDYYYDDDDGWCAYEDAVNKNYSIRDTQCVSHLKTLNGAEKGDFSILNQSALQ